ncbi:MAG: DUF1800 domain-containing protein [Chloroflexi bacterium]|nr:DUF1800 domain-containing protein [Chloroflexota bacterium]
MQTSRRDFLRLMGLTSAAVAIGGQSLLAWEQFDAPLVASNLALHLLNRITYGVRPQDSERAAALGIEAYLDEQLNPERIDDSAMDARLLELPILNMDRYAASLLPEREYRTYKALMAGMVWRAVYSERQLLERMAEFWTDHFNIPSDELGVELVTFQRQIRQHALGNFRDLLFASAQSPAVLYYLDNYLNNAEHPNENYARELMELHTLGVDGGYTERDVKEVARAFTGWTVHDGTDTGFYFDPSTHDTGKKNVLGHPLPADRGIEDGLHVLSILTNHPATARYLCYKLCVRFVSDDPPSSLVDSAAAIWTANRGAIKPVLRHILLSAEFQTSAGQKLRRPLDFFIGVLRATGTEIHDFYTMENLLLELAQPPFGWHPPDGYPDKAGAWMSSAGLLARWNVAMMLTHGAYSDLELQKTMTAHLHEYVGSAATVGELVDRAAARVFGGRIPDAARAAFIAFAADGGESVTPVTPLLLSRKLGTLYGLMLASPLYQWR